MCLVVLCGVVSGCMVLCLVVLCGVVSGCAVLCLVVLCGVVWSQGPRASSCLCWRPTRPRGPASGRPWRRGGSTRATPRSPCPRSFIRTGEDGDDDDDDSGYDEDCDDDDDDDDRGYNEDDIMKT